MNRLGKVAVAAPIEGHGRVGSDARSSPCSNRRGTSYCWASDAGTPQDRIGSDRFGEGTPGRSRLRTAGIKVKCQEGHELYMEDYERKACPKCGRVVVGPKAK